MRITGIDHVQVATPAGSEQQAREFYAGVLGLEEVPKPEELAVRGGAWFRCGSQQLHVGIEDDFRPATKAHPGLFVEGLDELSEALVAAGCKVKLGEDMPGRRRIFVNDPFGNRLEIIELVSE